MAITRGYQSNANPHVVVEHVPRREFVRAFGKDHVRGQHVSLFGPTGRGKSHLAYQLLGEVISPDYQVFSLHGKIRGRDPVVMSVAKRYRLRMVDELPSRQRQELDRRRKYNGYLIVPLTKPTTYDEEHERLQGAFSNAIGQNYRTTKRKTITHINEAHQTQKDLKLLEAIEAPLMRGGPDNGIWQEAQRGRYLSYHTYSEPEHIFVFLDPDADNRKRYSDMGCADPHEVYDITSRLRTQRSRDGRTISECLYIRRGSGDMYVVGT